MISSEFNCFTIAGDFNINIDNAEIKTTKEIINVLNIFDLIQHVHGTTHNRGHTLDLLISRGLNISSIVIKDAALSDHVCIFFDILISVTTESRSVSVRKRCINENTSANAYLDSRGQTTKNQVRNLGVILETDLSFSNHVKTVTKSAYYHLKNIARIRSFVSSQDLEKRVHAFITSRVDYCNGLLTGLPKKTIRQLQLIQNAAARILTRTRTSEHITPVLRSLHWLPVTFRIDFKVLLLI